jgi:hypothetical protein
MNLTELKTKMKKVDGLEESAVDGKFEVLDFKI